MKSRILLCLMITNLHQIIGTSPDRDIATVTKRVAHEGESFLSMGLPQLDDLLTQALDAGRLPEIQGWRLDKNGLPVFLGTFFRRIFSSDRYILPTPCIHSIRAIRQISRAFKKVFEVCSTDRVDDAVKSFVETDRSLSAVTYPKYGDALRDVANAAFGRTIGEVVSIDPLLMGRHGPGAVAEKLSSPSKWDFDLVNHKVVDHFGHEFFRATWDDLINRPPIESDIPARLIAVPKTASKPRLISIEPSATQFAQQCYAAELKRHLSRFPSCQFTWQEPNQLLAKAGSIDGSLATIDLSEASDRVHYGLLKMMFAWNPAFVSILDATRTREVQLPDGSVLALNKYASMGSALTFPIETMVFTIAIMTAICAVERRWDRSYIRSLLRREDIRAYGDDLIVPVQYVPTLIEILESMGLKVNTKKSFWSGKFRESCGADWYDGKSVKPIYVRRQIPQSVRHVDELVSFSSFRDQWVVAYGEGILTESIDKHMEMLLGSYPLSPDPTRTPAITRRGTPESVRWNPHLQIIEQKAHVPKYVRRPANSTEYGRLHGNLRATLRPLGHLSEFELKSEKTLAKVVTPPSDPQLWTHDGRPTSAKLKRRWLAVP